ncbi:MAG: hypothetical protein GC168_05215 [Candidatus Hydrogenedens sp.]|nr:hypothetical protein [Candidatus Hydrogenedens sp.]
MSVISVYMERRGTPLRQEGKWACGPCPACGGKDRYRVVFNPTKGCEHYSCRQCGAHGDDVQFLRTFVGMTYGEAKRTAERLRVSSPSVPQVIDDEEAWHDACCEFIARSHEQLLSSGKRLARLHAERGIEAETAAAFHLGYNARDRWEPRADFGLCAKQRPDGSPADLCLPEGIVIPVVRNGDLMGVQVRRAVPFHGYRFATVPGSERVPMTFHGDDDKHVVVVESYLCGMLVWKALQGRATVLALGSVSVSPDRETAAMLDRADTVLVALDSDEAGAAQARRNWIGRYRNAMRCPIPGRYGKDPTDAWRNGLDLAEWFEAGLSIAADSPRVEATETVAVDDRELRVGENAARMVRISKPETARSAVAKIVRWCSAIAVSITVEADPEHAAHPLAGYHTALSVLDRVAVYAPELGRVYVFRVRRTGTEVLAPLWKLPVAVHDGGELLRHLPALLDAGEQVACTGLMASALSNRFHTFDEIADACLGLPSLDVHYGPDTGLALRAMTTAGCCAVLETELADRSQGCVYAVLCDAQRAIAAMEVEGVFFDAEAHRDLCTRWESELTELRSVLPEGMNPNSHKDVRAWLLKIVPQERRAGWERTSTDALSTGDANLALADDIPEVHALREYRRLAKMLSTFGHGFAEHLNPATGRLHARWRLGGCTTGRMSCKDPNLLALPRDPAFRSLFRAPEGRVLLVADVSQFQLRIAAHIADDRVMLEAYASDLDLHTATAATLTGRDPGDVTAEERRMAKAANFGLLFGQGAKGFRDYAERKYGLDLTKREAAHLRDAWLENFDGIAAWHAETRDCLDAGGEVRTAQGRTADGGDLRGNDLQQALAFQVQGTEAEVMMRALATLDPVLREHDARLVLFVHDEVVLEVPDDDDTVAALSCAVETTVADAFRRYYPDAATRGLVEVHAVDNWAEAK